MPKQTDFASLLPPEMDQEALLQGIAQIQELRALHQLYNGAIREMRTKLENLDDEFRTRYDHNPIHHIESRLKKIASILDKLQRKGLPLSLESARESLDDIAGIRVICNYIDDIYTMADMLCQQDDIQLIRRTDYIENPKENGYRSLHLVVRVPVFLSAGSEKVPVEIQIRTIAMDFWASLEHQLRYKSDQSVPQSLREELRECAEHSAALDLKMQNIYRQLTANKS